MCGIAGIINKNGAPIDRGLLERMTERVHHRGPDGFGYDVSGNVGLGHRRLAIIDLSDGGSQPMHSSDGRLTITFNGEIYNYLEIRENLQRRGHRFVSSSDTEVILAAYAEWGADCVHRFNGMWAFAIHDRERQLLFCSRDRFGVKPFNYIDNGRIFAFGSEIKQLVDLLPERAANKEVMQTFLITGLIDYSANTFFQDVRKLLPGHNLLVQLQSGAVACRQYYRVHATDLDGATPEEIERRFLELFGSSIEFRLRSDVPVGICLSGGLDSSAIAMLAAPRYESRSGQRLCAITAISTAPESDESRYAQQMVERARLRGLSFTPTPGDFVNAMPDIAYHQDEPIPSPSPVMQYFVMRTARENGITVLLDGQGADETLLGYQYYFGVYLRSVCRENGVVAGLQALRSAVAQNTRLSYGSALKYIFGTATPRLRYVRDRLAVPYLHSAPPLPQILCDHAASASGLRSFQAQEISANTLPSLLRYEDRNSMAFGVETRLPFLDYRLVELCVGLSINYKIRDGWTKWILRHCMTGTVPDAIVWRKDKIGFEAPDAFWMAAEESHVRRTIIGSELVRSISNDVKLDDCFSSMTLRNRWRLYSLAVWSEQFGIGAASNGWDREVLQTASNTITESPLAEQYLA
jgi:asparagine synthase (glutamine-hydrolysing)